MKRKFEIISKESLSNILSSLDSLIELPRVKLLDFGNTKKYTGEITGNKFWLTWTKTSTFIKGKPIVKGIIHDIENVNKLEISIYDYSSIVTIILTMIFMSVTMFFIKALIEEQDYKSIFIICSIILLLLAICIFNHWKVKVGIDKMEKEIREILQDN